jgi:nicotinamidase/pyrazinamidase
MDPRIDSYSGFFDNGQKKATGLEGYLRGRGVTEVHVAGLAADYCVYYTAKDALSLGFKSAIVLEATRAIDAAGFALAQEQFLKLGGLLR